jgi:hypothetical protein
MASRHVSIIKCVSPALTSLLIRSACCAGLWSRVWQLVEMQLIAGQRNPPHSVLAIQCVDDFNEKEISKVHAPCLVDVIRNPLEAMWQLYALLTQVQQQRPPPDTHSDENPDAASGTDNANAFGLSLLPSSDIKSRFADQQIFPLLMEASEIIVIGIKYHAANYFGMLPLILICMISMQGVGSGHLRTLTASLC